VRDIDVMSDLSKRASFSVTFSVPTVDDEVWRRTEPGTAHPRQRLQALSRLVAAGIKASVGMAPILPGLSDRPEQLEEVVKAARPRGEGRDGVARLALPCSRQAQHPLGEDVELDLRRSTADREGGRKEEGLGPGRVQEQSGGAQQLQGELVDLLAPAV